MRLTDTNANATLVWVEPEYGTSKHSLLMVMSYYGLTSTPSGSSRPFKTTLPRLKFTQDYFSFKTVLKYSTIK